MSVEQLAMAIARIGLAIVIAPAGLIQSQSQSVQNQQQTEFSMEREIVPIRRPITLPEAGVQVLKKDSAVSSCAADENLPNDQILQTWFVASEIDLAQQGEPGLIVLPAEVFSPSTMKPAPNGCFLGPYTMTFWVLGKIGDGYKVILRVNAHDLIVRKNRRNGYRDIETSISNMHGSTTELYGFDGLKYSKLKETVTP